MKMDLKVSSTMQITRATILYSILFFTNYADAFTDKIKIRAREHFEAHEYSVDGVDEVFEFKGLTNTINLWYEKPFHYSFGLALGPVIGSAKAEDSSVQFGEKVQLWVAGLEGKYFPLKEDYRGFVRLGMSWHKLDTDGSFDSLEGWGLYSGLGWEFPWGKVSIAPELAFRKVYLEKDVEGDILTPSIGFHFYPELNR